MDESRSYGAQSKGFSRNTSLSSMVNYRNPVTSGQIQDALRAEYQDESNKQQAQDDMHQPY